MAEDGNQSPMLKRLAGRAVAILDWLWPLPLGLFFGALVFSVLAGTWLAFREPGARLRPPLRAETHSRPNAPALPAAPPPPTDIARRAETKPSVDSDFFPGEVSTESPPAASPSPQAVRAGEVSSPALRPPQGEVAEPREGKPKEKPVLAASLPKKPEATAKPTAPAAGHQLSAAQEAELKDKLTLGWFLMDRKEYREAIAQFKAALDIDPSNREAQKAIQQARDAMENPGSSTQP